MKALGESIHFYPQLFLLVAFLRSVPALTAQSVPVTWTSLSNAHTDANSLTADGFGAGGRSSQLIAHGAGSFHFTVFAQNHQVVAADTAEIYGEYGGLYWQRVEIRDPTAIGSAVRRFIRTRADSTP